MSGASTAPRRVAIIGAGIGREHLYAYQNLAERFEVAVVGDRDEVRAKEIAAGAGIATASDIETVLADPSIDIVDVCLPPFLHLPISVQALEAGKHVVCEKPMVTSLKEVDALAAAIASSGKVFSPVFQYRFGPGMAKLQALINAGLAGKPLVASIETHWNRDAAYYANPWRGTWKGEQGGAVLGHAIHAHDYLCAVFGPVARLSAFIGTRVNPIQTEDCAAISLQMSSGAMATSSITLGANDDTSRYRFVFEGLTAESGLRPYAPASDEWTFSARGATTQAQIIEVLRAVPPVRQGFEGFLEAFDDAIEGKRNTAVTLADGRQSLELVTAIYQSARTGTVVDLPLRDSPLYDTWVPQGGML